MEKENNPENEGGTCEEPINHGFWKSWIIELEPYLLYGASLIAVLIFGYYSGYDVSWVVII